MPRLKYIAMTVDGRCTTEEHDIEDSTSLAHELQRRGLILVSVETLKPAGSFTLRRSIPPRVMTAFLRELALLLRSGLPLAEALDLAAQDAQSVLAEAIGSLRRELISGASFVQALQHRSDIFSVDIIAMARVAEATGDFATVFGALATQRARSHALAEKALGALGYPLFLVVSALSVLAFFLLHVIPQFSDLFAQQKNPPPGLTRLVFGLSDWLVIHENGLIIGAIGVLAAGLIAFRSSMARSAVLGFLSGLPFVRNVVKTRRAALLLSNLSVLLGQGVPLIESLSVLEDLVGGQMQAIFASLRDVVRQGGRLNDALKVTDMLPPLAVRMLRIGEETGELIKAAEDAGALYSHKLEKQLDQITALAGPAAILLIAGIIGGMMVAVMSAIISVNDMAI